MVAAGNKSILQLFMSVKTQPLKESFNMRKHTLATALPGGCRHRSKPLSWHFSVAGAAATPTTNSTELPHDL